MNGAQVLDVGREAIWLTLQLSAPVMIVALVVGVGIGLLQALTQVQEQTPKILAVFLSLLVFLPLMGVLMGGFMHTIAAHIAGM